MSAPRIEMLNNLGFAWSAKGRKACELEHLEHAFNEREIATAAAPFEPPTFEPPVTNQDGAVGNDAGVEGGNFNILPDMNADNANNGDGQTLII